MRHINFDAVVQAALVYAPTAPPQDELQTEAPRAMPTGRPSRLLFLPSDVFQEAYSYLSPKDLVHLSRICKFMCRFLHTSCSAVIWRQSFRNIPDTPRPPPGKTNAQWARYLFGGMYCSTPGCDRRGRQVQFVFAYFRKACKHCLRKFYLTERQLEGNPQLTSIPRTVREDYLLHEIEALPQTLHRYWSRNALDEVEREMRAMQITWESPFTKQASQFLNNKRDAAVSLLKHAKKCVAWGAQEEEGRKARLRADRERRQVVIVSHLLRRGHTIVDVKAVAGHHEFRSMNPITEKNLPRILNTLEPLIVDASNTILAPETLSAFWSPLVWASYAHVLMTVPRRIANLLPDWDEFLALDPIANLFTVEIPTRAASGDIDLHVSRATRSGLRKVEERWGQRVKAVMSALPKDSTFLSNVLSYPCDDKTALYRPPSIGLASVEGLDLASAVFQCDLGCASCNCLFFGLEILGHRCDTPFMWCEEPWAKFHELGYQAMRTILHVLGKDPAMTTVAELDSQDPRFYCPLCPPEYFQVRNGSSPRTGPHVTTAKGRPAMCWRSATRHSIEVHRQPYVPWKLASAADLRVVEELEQHRPPAANASRAWGCCRCDWSQEAPVHDGRWIFQAEVVKHIHLCHRIDNPRQNDDYIYNLRQYRQPNAHILISMT